jgi:hypothetical protein
MYVSSPLGFPGSIPETVMRTGDIMTFNPNDIRALTSEQTVERMTRIPVGMPPGVASYGPPPYPPFSAPTPSAVAGFGADGGDNSAWAWGLVAVLVGAAGFAGYKAVRG